MRDPQQTTATVRSIRTDRGDTGKRLDHVLRRHLADLEAASRTAVQRWIEEGRVAVDGTSVTRVSSRVPASAAVTVLLPPTEPDPPSAPAPMVLDVLYEDECLLAVNKPPGIVAHPTHAHAAGTLLNGLLWHARAWPPGDRPSIVGRLDRQTSGLVLVARSAATHAALQRALRDGDKDYLAVVYGRVNERSGRITFPLARDPRDRRRMAVSPDGAPSTTLFERLGRASSGGGSVTLLRCRLLTGRTHQIRIHLASRGWPIVGDTVYRGAETPKCQQSQAQAVVAFPRQALHAWRTTFVHPYTNVRLRLEAPMPDDLRSLIVATGLAASASAS